MDRIYDYVMENLKEKTEREELIKKITEKFSASELYEESNLRFYFEEDSKEIIANADMSRHLLLKVEKEDTLKNIKKYICDEIRYSVYNIYTDNEGNPELEISFECIDDNTGIIDYIFEEFLKSDIEYYLNENE